MATATQTDAERIRGIAERHTGDGWRFYDGYSGRGMFGARCPGITCPPSEVSRVKQAVRRVVKSEAAVDNLSLDMIVYWPFLLNA